MPKTHMNENQPDVPRHSVAAKFCAILALAAGMTGIAPIAEAQDKWPSRRVTLVVPFAAGIGDRCHGAPDRRPVADAASASRSSSRTAPAPAACWALARSPRPMPDGYTLLMGGNTTHSAVRALFKNVPYDPIDDFTPIARIGKFGSVLATNPQQPFKTIQEFVAYAKANPGKLSCGHGNSTGHITCETVKARLGLDMARVPYKSNPPALQDLLVQQHPADGAGFPHRRAADQGRQGDRARRRDAPAQPDAARRADVPRDRDQGLRGGAVGRRCSARQSCRRPSSSQMSDALGEILKKPDVVVEVRRHGHRDLVRTASGRSPRSSRPTSRSGMPMPRPRASRRSRQQRHRQREQVRCRVA